MQKRQLPIPMSGSAESHRNATHGMYWPDMESDAGGVGLIAATDGRDATDDMHAYLKAKAASERKAA